MDESLSFDEHVGRNVRELRESAGLTQTQLADACMEHIRAGAPSETTFRQQTIDKVERGQRRLRLDEALVMASALDCDVEVLCETERLVFNQALLVRRRISEFLRAEAAWHQAIGDVVDVQRHLKWDLESVARRGTELPPEVLSQLEYLAQMDLSAQTPGIIENHLVTEHPPLSTEGMRDAHPSRFDTRV